MEKYNTIYFGMNKERSVPAGDPMLWLVAAFFAKAVPGRSRWCGLARHGHGNRQLPVTGAKLALI
jgi:hypothetical protein